jgi:hypothetical protein
MHMRGEQEDKIDQQMRGLLQTVPNVPQRSMEWVNKAQYSQPQC